MHNLPWANINWIKDNLVDNKLINICTCYNIEIASISIAEENTSYNKEQNYSVLYFCQIFR